MTPIEMQNNFLVEVKARDFGATVDSSDIFYYLNKAQEKWLKEKYDQGFEVSQALVDDLRVFLKKDVELDAKYAGDSARFKDYYVDYVEFPNDYLHAISYRSKVLYSFKPITFTVTNGSRVPNESTKSAIYFNRFSQSDDIYKLLEDPFNSTKHTRPLVDINDRRINIYTNKKFVVDKVYLNYLREPKEISVETDQACELPEVFHEEIVEQAVGLYAKFLNSQEDNKNN